VASSEQFEAWLSQSEKSCMGTYAY